MRETMIRKPNRFFETLQIAAQVIVLGKKAMTPEQLQEAGIA